MITKLLIDEGELYLKEFVDVLLNNGYKVTVKKTNCVDHLERETTKFLYEIEIDD